MRLAAGRCAFPWMHPFGLLHESATLAPQHRLKPIAQRSLPQPTEEPRPFPVLYDMPRKSECKAPSESVNRDAIMGKLQRGSDRTMHRKPKQDA